MNLVEENPYIFEQNNVNIVNIVNINEVEKMEKVLGLEKIKPITLTPSDLKQLEAKNDPFREWYEEELRALYKKNE